MVSDRKICQLELSGRGEKILQAAQNLFLQHGFENTSLDMIINESGGSRRSIYSEFGNKQGLLMAVISHNVSTQLDVLSSIDYQKPIADALKDVCIKFVRGFLSPTKIALFRLVTQVVVYIPEIGELIYNEGPLKGPTPLANYLQFQAQQGLISIKDPHFSAQMLIEMCKGKLHLQAMLLPNQAIPEQEIEQHVNDSVDMFIQAHRV